MTTARTVLLLLVLPTAGCLGGSTDEPLATQDAYGWNDVPEAESDAFGPAGPNATATAPTPMPPPPPDVPPTIELRPPVRVTNYTDLIECAFAYADPYGTPAEGAYWSECGTADPRPRYNRTSPPWKAIVNLTTPRLKTWGLNEERHAVELKLTWNTNRGMGEAFRLCYATNGTTAPGVVCHRPSPGNLTSNSMNVTFTIFEASAVWKAPAAYRVWIEPAAWLQGCDYGAPACATSKVEQSSMENWRFYLNAWVHHDPDYIWRYYPISAT